MRNLRQIIGRVGEIAAKAERELLIAFVFIIVLLVFLGIVVRYTPATGIMWTTEAARFALIWLAFWAAGSAERVNGHFRFDLFEGLFKGKSQLLLQLFMKLLLSISMGLLIWWTIVYFWITKGVTTYILQWPWPVWVLPLFFGSSLLFAHCLNDIIRIFRRLLKKC